MGQRWCLSIPLEDILCPLISRRYIPHVSWLGCALCQDLIQDVSWPTDWAVWIFLKGISVAHQSVWIFLRSISRAHSGVWRFLRSRFGGLEFSEERSKNTFGGLEFSEEHFKSTFGGLDCDLNTERVKTNTLIVLGQH